MENEKVLVEVYIPAAQLRNDFYLPLQCKVIDVKMAVLAMYKEHNFFKNTDLSFLHIYNGDTGQALDFKQILLHCGIRNGTCLFML